MSRRIDAFYGTLSAFRRYVQTECDRLGIERPVVHKVSEGYAVMTETESRRIIWVRGIHSLRGFSADHVEPIVSTDRRAMSPLEVGLMRENERAAVMAATQANRDREAMISRDMARTGMPYELAVRALEAEREAFERGISDWA